MTTEMSTLMWGSFAAIAIGLLVLDLGFLHRKAHDMPLRESVRNYLLYFSCGVAFGLWIWFELGANSATMYYTALLLETSLSLDNLFVISLIFASLGIPKQYQHRVLFWGIIGVVVFRAVMIGVGVSVVREFEWVLYLFGLFLLFTGIKMLWPKGEEKHQDIKDGKLYRFLTRYLPFSDHLHGQKLWVREDGKLKATPLFLALCLVEAADIIFAVDSIPAVLAVTQDVFIVYTSNIFAILGLRSLYFLLVHMIGRFYYLKYAIAAVLVFIGAKISVLYFGFHMPPLVSLMVTVLLLSSGVVVSLIKTRER